MPITSSEPNLEALLSHVSPEGHKAYSINYSLSMLPDAIRIQSLIRYSSEHRKMCPEAHTPQHFTDSTGTGINHIIMRQSSDISLEASVRLVTECCCSLLIKACS